jgi:hypothetical protein
MLSPCARALPGGEGEMANLLTSTGNIPPFRLGVVGSIPADLTFIPLWAIRRGRADAGAPREVEHRA